MLAFRAAGIHKMLVRKVKREDTDQTASWSAMFGLFGRQLVFDILEHLP